MEVWIHVFAYLCVCLSCVQKLGRKKHVRVHSLNLLNFIWRDHPLLLKILVDIIAPINFIVKVKSFYLAE